MNATDELSAIEMNAVERQIEAPARGDVTLSLDVARRLLAMAKCVSDGLFDELQLELSIAHEAADEAEGEVEFLQAELNSRDSQITQLRIELLKAKGEL